MAATNIPCPACEVGTIDLAAKAGKRKCSTCGHDYDARNRRAEPAHETLKPCRTCGSGDVRWCSVSHRPYCGDCNQWGAVNMGTDAEAIDAWNRRAALLRAEPVGEPVADAVVEYADRYRTKWADKPEGYWLQRIMQEVGELASVLAGDHDDTVEHELTQIASIAVNWLRHRAAPPAAPEAQEPEPLRSQNATGTQMRDDLPPVSAAGEEEK